MQRGKIHQFLSLFLSRVAWLAGPWIWNRFWPGIVGISLLATLPLAFVTYPPMVDLPQHAAQMGLLHSLQKPDFPFSDLFWANWFSPYLLGYLLVWLVAPITGTALAAKLVVALCLAAFPPSVALLLQATGSDRRYAWLLIPTLYGFSFYWGFLNYIVAAPLGMLFLAALARHNRNATIGSAIGIALAIQCLFFFHALVWVLCLAMGLLFVVFSNNSLLRRLRRSLLLLASLPMAAVWMAVTIARDSQMKDGITWDMGFFRLDPFPLITGIQAESGGSLLGVALFAIPVLLGGRPSRKPERIIPFAGCLFVLLFWPDAFLGNSFTYQRFAIYLLPFFLLMLEPMSGDFSSRRDRFLCAAVLVLAVGHTAGKSLAMAAFERESSGYREVIAHMNPRHRALSLVMDRYSEFFRGPVYIHFPAWYQAEKQGVVDFNFANFYVQVVRYRLNKTPEAGPGFEWRPKSFNWKKHGADQYEYFVVRSPNDPGSTIFGKSLCRVDRIVHSGDWWLYRQRPSTDKPCRKIGSPRNAVSPDKLRIRHWSENLRLNHP